MEPNLAKRDLNLDIDRDSSTAGDNMTRPSHKTNRKETSTEDSKAEREIEAFVLEKSATKSIVLSRLVRDLSDELAYKPDQIISEIIRLRTERRILIREPVVYRRFPDYLLSPNSMWFWEVALATLASLGLTFASSGWALYFRYVFGGLMVLFLPGYSLVGLIYSKKDDLDYPTRVAISFALSLGIATLVGLVLNFTPFGITLFAVAFSLGAVTVGLLLLTALRRYAYYRLARIVETEKQSLIGARERSHHE
jgi:hypothetical protein